MDDTGKGGMIFSCNIPRDKEARRAEVMYRCLPGDEWSHQ